jgi:hypothetical protein
MNALALVVGLPLPPEAVQCLKRNGFLQFPPLPPPGARAATGGFIPFIPLTSGQGRICAALTRQPLNSRQAALLGIYWHAYREGESALSIEDAGRRLAAAAGLDPARAADYVRGALRSFGRRLLRTADAAPSADEGRNHPGEGGGDAIPLLALLAIETGPSGEARHRLTDDGAVAVATALGLGRGGTEAEGGSDDPDAVVAVGMSRAAAALLLRVQHTLGLGIDDTVKTLAAQAGAG